MLVGSYNYTYTYEYILYGDVRHGDGERLRKSPVCVTHLPRKPSYTAVNVVYAFLCSAF